MRRTSSLVVAFILAALPLAPLQAQGGSLKGTVSDSAGNALSGATITIEGTTLKAISGNSGAYQIANVPAGTYSVRARLIGYTAQAARVTIARGEEITRNFALLQSAVQIAPIDVVVGSRARHNAGEELAVPVDVFTAEDLAQQGSNEYHGRPDL